MGRINILDCTLRDGGYVNDFRFGNDVIKDVITKLSRASIDIIECGWLKSGACDEDKTQFCNIDAIKKVILKKNLNIMYVAMIQYGAISDFEVAERDEDSIDGIRVTFHENEIEGAFSLARELMAKGYKVFIQPVGTTAYTDEALLKLVRMVNELMPFAFYLVDTLGVMYKSDLLRMYYLIDHNMDNRISFGFHSHNNLQLSFANAQELARLNTPRDIIIDSSVFGMGRGAGNLNTELLTQFINTNFGYKYDNIEILEILDQYIKPLSLQYKWGYDAAYYIASVCGCHPNYASYLSSKQTLHVQDIRSILNSLDPSKRDIFDKEYIGEKYLEYLNHYVDDESVVEKLKKEVSGKKVIVIAPGKSVGEHEKDLKKIAMRDDNFVISINFIPKEIPVNMMFISNMKRFGNLKELEKRSGEGIHVIATSNIMSESSNNIEVVNFSSYINEDECISDNAGLMCLNLLKKIGVDNVLLAGFDGFTDHIDENYYATELILDVEVERLQNMNLATKRKMEQLEKQMKIEHIYNSIYQG